MKVEWQKMWTNCQEGIHILAVYLWHSEGWSVRNEALTSTVLKKDCQYQKSLDHSV